MTYPRVQFVASPDVDAEVRFDFNTAGEWSDEDTWPQHEGFTLGAPSLEGDPSAYGVEFGLRTLAFNLIIEGTYEAASRVWSALARENVSRRTNWLMVQFSAFSEPVWFRTYRTAPEALDFELVDDAEDARKNMWGLGVTLAADPFAYGAELTFAPVVVPNNAFVAGGCTLTTPAVVGDAPAPVSLRVSSTKDWSGHTPLFSSIALEGGDYSGAPVPVSLELATGGTDTGAWVANTNFEAGGSRPVTFATTATMAERIRDNATVLPLGRYRVFVWVAALSSSTAVFRVRGGRPLGSGQTIYNDTVEWDRPATTGADPRTWLDLGEFSIPAGLSMDDREASSSAAAKVLVEAERVSGTGDLRLCALLYVPVETPWSIESRMFRPEFGYTGLATTHTAEWSASGYRAFLSSSLPTRVVQDVEQPVPAGGLPVLVPGCTNTLTVLQQTRAATPADPASDNRDILTDTATVTISYRPLWLHLAAS